VRADGSGSANVATATSLHWDITRGGDIRTSVLDKITVCWAGGVAETIKFNSADNHGDRVLIEQLAARYYIQDRDIKAARERARELLLLHWDKVEAVATALIDKKILSGTEIDRLCNCQ
jgi:hypothetical protein